eukprot:scaffold7912_cov31-Phaeocystis_antarctica.AAC.2
MTNYSVSGGRTGEWRQNWWYAATPEAAATEAAVVAEAMAELAEGGVPAAEAALLRPLKLQPLRHLALLQPADGADRAGEAGEAAEAGEAGEAGDGAEAGGGAG